MKPGRIALALIATAAAGFSLTGCGGSSPMLTEKPGSPSPVQMQGQVKGGQQPITNATIQLYAVGTSGYGSAATPVFSPAITTDGNGDFTFPDSYCPSNPNDLVYLVATGGQPTGASPVNGSIPTNANEALMVALGPCSNITADTHISINELTTVAAVWALAPFMSGTTDAYLNIGSPASNATGLALAFNAAEQVTNTSTGAIGGANLPAGATLPTAEIISLADILGYCVNSGGGAEGDSSNCGAVFGDAPNTAGTAYPTDTITAAMNIALNPAANVPALYVLGGKIPVYTGGLGSAPTAWTLAIQYKNGGLSAPTAIAADQAGNIWVTNSGAPTVSKFDNLGNSLLGNGTTISAGTPTGLAVDASGNAWITVSSANSLIEVSSSGTAGAAITTPLSEPTSVAIDGGGLVWVANSGGTGGNSVSIFTSTGGVVAGSPFGGGGIASPAGIAINGNANANCSDCNQE
ncbi:MAG TPA: hypothetical protein VHX37_15945 [Acidobacteriaceae bacterium]|jgi:hypothetical protein|nr:hypothetical protein [Acidobacteriaceae bacterium]